MCEAIFDTSLAVIITLLWFMFFGYDVVLKLTKKRIRAIIVFAVILTALIYSYAHLAFLIYVNNCGE